MKREIAEEWVRRLESGNYQQGKGRLRTQTFEGDYRYCCLGILTEIAVEAGVTTWKTLNDACYVSGPVKEWAGCNHNPVFSDGNTAIHWNDSFGKSFVEIAAAVRETYLK